MTENDYKKGKEDGKREATLTMRVAQLEDDHKELKAGQAWLKRWAWAIVSLLALLYLRENLQLPGL